MKIVFPRFGFHRNGNGNGRGWVRLAGYSTRFKFESKYHERKGLPKQNTQLAFSQLGRKRSGNWQRAPNCAQHCRIFLSARIFVFFLFRYYSERCQAMHENQPQVACSFLSVFHHWRLPRLGLPSGRRDACAAASRNLGRSCRFGMPADRQSSAGRLGSNRLYRDVFAGFPKPVQSNFHKIYGNMQKAAE